VHRLPIPIISTIDQPAPRASRPSSTLPRPDKARIALLVRAAGAEAEADESGPRAALEEEDGEDDAEGEAERGADEEGGEAAVPLYSSVVSTNSGMSYSPAWPHPSHQWVATFASSAAGNWWIRTFSFNNASDTCLVGRTTTGGGGMEVSDIFVTAVEG